MAVREIKSKLAGVEGEVGEIDITYWGFPMVYMDREREYFMVLLDDTEGVQYIAFSSFEDDAQFAIRFNGWQELELWMEFERFAEAVDQVFKSMTHELTIIRGGNGSFVRVSDETVEFTTACGMRYTLYAEDLRDLAS